MGRILKKSKRITVTDLLDLDLKDKKDQNYLAFMNFIVGLEAVMAKKQISKNELARRMDISRQAVYDKFAGRNLTMDWIQRACDAVEVDLQIRFVEKSAA